jgi:hypothetical protein
MIFSSMVIPKVSVTHINSKGSSRPNKEEKPLGSVYVPYVKGVSKKFKHIGNQSNIRMTFKTKYTLRSSLMKNKAGKTSTTDSTVCLLHSLQMWQKLLW